MTSASLFFKLQKEDLKRRIWVVALLFLGFFFAYPVNLALTMENAANSQFAMYNGYTPLVNTGTPEYLAKVLEVHMYLLNFVHVVLHGTLDFLMISENYYNSFHFSFLSEVLHKALYASFPKPTSHYLPDHHMEYSRTDSLLTLIHLVDQIYKLQTKI